MRQLALRAAVNRHWREKRQCLSPAFFFVLEKAVKSAGNAVIPTFPAHSPHGLQHLRHKRPMFAFTSESGYTLGFRRRIAHKGSHAETGGISDGALSLSSTRTARSRTSPGRVSERQTLPFWGLDWMYSPKTQKACGTAMRLCASLFRGVAAPLGCVICLQLGDVAVFSLCAQYFLNVRGGGGITTLGAFHTVRKPCVARG